MAKAQVAAARFMTEVAPPEVVSVMRRRKVPRSLDTIAEDESEQLVACGAASDHGFAAAAVAWSLERMPTSKYFSDAHGCQASGWEGGHKLGHRPVHAQELNRVRA